MFENILENNEITDWLFAGGIILSLVIIVMIINKLFKSLYLKIYKLKGSRIKAIQYRDYQILSAEYNVKLIISSIKVLRVLLILLIVYLCLPFVFRFLPWTKHIADNLIQLTLTPVKSVIESVINYLPNLFFIAVILVIVRFLTKILKYFTSEIEKEKLVIRGFYKEWTRPTFNLVRIILYIFCLVLIFPYLPGSDSPAFQGVSIFLGVLLSLGSTAFVANAVGGLMIIYMRPFAKGDVIKVGDFIGTVVSKNMLVTRIKTPKDEVVSVPNKTIVDNNVINYSNDEVSNGILIFTEITIGYDIPWRKVHYIMENAAKNTADILENPAPFVLQKALNDFSVCYEINARINEPTKMNKIKSELLQNLQDGFAKAEIEILSPHYYAFRKGEESTIPKSKES